MHKKKYGKITVSAWLNLEMSQSSPALMLLFGLGLMIAGIMVQIHTGSPYRVILELGVKEIMPQVWLFVFLRFLSFFRRMSAPFRRLRVRWRDRKTHVFRKCPHCKKTLRLPRVPGDHFVNCPLCHTHFSVHVGGSAAQ